MVCKIDLKINFFFQIVYSKIQNLDGELTSGFFIYSYYILKSPNNKIFKQCILN